MNLPTVVSSRPLAALVLLSVTACTPETGGGGRPTGTGTTTTPMTGTTVTTDTGTITTPTGTTSTVPYDCTTAPTSPGVSRPVPAARGSYDLIFDDDGYLIGWNNGLIKADVNGNAQMFAPTVGISQGMAWMPDGTLAVAEIGTQAILRVDPATGGASLLTTDVPAYGLKLGPDGMLYAGTDNDLVRIDPTTGDRELLIDDPRFNVRSIDFSPDYSKLYMGTYFGDGRFWVVDLDANMDLVGDPYVFHPQVGNGTEHDAVGVDYCGNIFVVDYGTLTLYRLTPDGQKSVFLEFSNTHYGHGITWGSEVGGWNPMSIYLPEPWFGNTVIEIDVGVPSRTWTP